MKTIYHVWLLILALAFASCSGDDRPGEMVKDGPYEVTMTFNIGVSASTQTRARVFKDTECRQESTDVRVYVFRSDTGIGDESFKLYETDPALMKPGEAEATPHIYVTAFDNEKTGNPDEEERHSFTITDKLSGGYYRFLAVGRDDDVSESLRKIDWKAGITSWNEVLMTNTENDARVTEFFSGFAANSQGEVLTVHVSGNGGFLADITLRRAVAGVFLYVKNIPEKVTSDFEWISGNITSGSEQKVTEVAVVAMTHNTELNLLTRSRGNKFATEATDLTGFFKLASITPEEGEEKFAATPSPDGQFVFPSALSEHLIKADYLGEGEEPVSMALCFYSGIYPMKLLPIRMARSEEIHSDVSSIKDDSPEDPSGRRYNLIANHLYCLGNKNDETDNPVDLEEALRNHDLEIIVIGAWQAIVDIEME